MGDVQELQRISRTARTTPGSSNAGALSTESTSPALDALGVCAILVQATNRLEETLSDSAAMTADGTRRSYVRLNLELKLTCRRMAGTGSASYSGCTCASFVSYGPEGGWTQHVNSLSTH
jgi:hypothetical protein